MKQQNNNHALLGYSFVIFGNSRYGGYHHREQSLALELAKREYQVLFIEEMPSLAAELRRLFRRIFMRYAVEESVNNTEECAFLRILRPPIIPTTFRSSNTPLLDRWIFKIWLKNRLSKLNIKNSIAIVTLPYWWYGFVNRKKYPFKFIHYDIYDLIEVSSRNKKALNRLKEGERKLQNEAKLVTYSAQTMKKSVIDAFPNAQSLYIPNASSNKFISQIENIGAHKGSKKIIGFIGSLDRRWIDRELILLAIKSFPGCDFSIYGSADNAYVRKLALYPNMKEVGFKNHLQLAQIVATFDVGLIPFKQNEITRVVNPLKLYEYCAAGIPVVAMRTEELEQYQNMVYLSDTREEFINNIRRAFTEDTNQRRLARQTWAKMNTWKHRVDEYLSILEKILENN